MPLGAETGDCRRYMALQPVSAEADVAPVPLQAEGLFAIVFGDNVSDRKPAPLA